MFKAGESVELKVQIHWPRALWTLAKNRACGSLLLARRHPKVRLLLLLLRRNLS